MIYRTFYCNHIRKEYALTVTEIADQRIPRKQNLHKKLKKNLPELTEKNKEKNQKYKITRVDLINIIKKVPRSTWIIYKRPIIIRISAIGRKKPIRSNHKKGRGNWNFDLPPRGEEKINGVFDHVCSKLYNDRAGFNFLLRVLAGCKEE